jgi:hypothetical protein
MTRKLELVMLLQERALSNWERRKRRLERIPPTVAAAGLIKARKGEPLTLEEYIRASLGFLPGEAIPKVEDYRNQERKKESSAPGGPL